MNCKPNQLVVVVRTPPGALEFLGRIYRTRELFTPCVGPICWSMSEGNLTAKNGITIDGIEDRFLKPIQPVGEGEVDEMVRIAGNPRRVKSSALQEYLRVTKDLSR